MPEGSFNLRVNDESPTVQKIECSKGNTYYFKIYRNLNLSNKAIAIVPIDSLTAKNEMKYVKKSPTRQATVFSLEKRNAFGIVFEPGRGFSKTEIINTTEGTASMLSFGGEGTIGFSYSHEFSDNFGWSAELQDQFSSLTPSVTNASVVFDRGIVSTTPYFTIPLKFTHEQKLKIGAGLDYHFNPVLTFDTEKLVDGFKDEWIYNNTLGYHLIAFFEMKLGKRLRGHSGLKYSNVHYTFESSKSYQPGTADFKTPHANTLAASFGLDYCF
jgi:hypothetical protein